MLGVRFLDVDFMRITFACASPTVYVITHYSTVRRTRASGAAAPRSGAARAPGACGGGGGGRQRNRENHQAPSPNAAYFLVLGRGWPVFGLPPWKKFSAADSRSSRSAQEDGCSSLPCRGVLCFRSGAREGPGDETARVIRIIFSPVKWALFCTRSVWGRPSQTLWIRHSFAFSFDHLVGSGEQSR